MARPSRGFSAPQARQTAVITCPTTGSTIINVASSSDWFIDYTWSPSVLVGTFSQFYRVNGGPWTLDQQAFNVNSGLEIELDPHGFADPGDFLEFKGVCDDIASCPPFETAPAGQAVEA